MIPKTPQLEREIRLEEDVAELREQLQTAHAEVERLRGALKAIGQSGPTDDEGNYNPDEGWSWCYETANKALSTPIPDNAASELVELLKTAHLPDERGEWSARKRKALAPFTGEKP